MNKADVAMLIAYNDWATQRVLAAAMNLSPGQFGSVPAGHPASLQALLVHVLSAERVWRVRFETAASPEPLRPDAFPTVAALRQGWQDEQQARGTYLATLDDRLLDEQIQFRRHSGELSAPFVRWHLLMQLITHGVSHRSEAAALLTVYGHSPGDLDFLVYLLEQPHAGGSQR